MIILVNLLGLLLIAFVYWFFFLKKESEVTVKGQIVNVLVSGGYKPSKIKAEAGQPLTLIFDRQDPSSCLEEVTIPAFGIRQFLTMNKKTEVHVPASKPGTYDIVCGMNMQHATLILEESK